MGIKISELTETNQLSDGCCIPVVNNGTTKKIKIKNLKTQLNPYFHIKEGHLFADGIDIGEVQGLNGKTAYELACEYGFVGTEEDFAKGLKAGASSGLVTEDFVKETVNNAVAEIVANAPSDFDTLKEMSDWISEHEDDATAMNTAILENKNKIETEITNRTNADTNLQNQINANKITVDTAMSSTSTNPVQNKVVNTALGNKVDKVSGKGLSTNDYTTTEKTKLSGIAEGANKTTVDSALSTSSTNPVQNKVVTSNINTLSTELDTLSAQVTALSGGNTVVYTCSTASGTLQKTVSINGFTLTTGVCIKVKFTNGNNIGIPTLNVNNTGAISIVTERLYPLSSNVGSRTWNGTTLTKSGAYKWEPNTTLDLMYNGSNWVVIGNPVVYEYATINQMTSDCDADRQYARVYIDGYKEQWGYYEGKSNTVTLRFICTFSDAYSYGISVISDFTNSTGTSSNYATIQSKTKNYAKIKNGTYENTWIAQGY